MRRLGFGSKMAISIAMATLLKVPSLKFMGVLQPEPMHIFLPNFQVMFDPRGSRDDKVLGICSNGGCHGNAF